MVTFSVKKQLQKGPLWADVMDTRGLFIPYQLLFLSKFTLSCFPIFSQLSGKHTKMREQTGGSNLGKLLPTVNWGAGGGGWLTGKKSSVDSPQPMVLWKKPGGVKTSAYWERIALYFITGNKPLAYITPLRYDLWAWGDVIESRCSI